MDLEDVEACVKLWSPEDLKAGETGIGDSTNTRIADGRADLVSLFEPFVFRLLRHKQTSFRNLLIIGKS